MSNTKLFGVIKMTTPKCAAGVTLHAYKCRTVLQGVINNSNGVEITPKIFTPVKRVGMVL